MLVAIAFLLLGGAALLTGAQPPAAPARTVGRNAPINPGATDLLDLRANNSPSVVRNPAHEANLVEVNRVDLPRFACALHVSHDGGATWSPTRLPPAGADNPSCYAPDAAFGADGTLYVVYVTLEGLGNVPSAVWLTRSADGGRTLSPPARVLGPRAFQVRLAADPATASRLYLTWMQTEATATLAFPDTGNPVRFARSDDGGLHWRASTRVSGASRERVIAPTLGVGSGGELYVLYLDLGEDRLDYEGGHGGSGGPPYAGRWSLVVARSVDGGRSWKESVVDDGVVPTERFVVFTPPFPSLAVDGRTGRIYVGFHDGRMGDADVWVWVSTDRGRTFARPVRVNETPRRDGHSQYLPKLAVAPDGRLDVLYYDRRADPRNEHNEVSLQSSSDGAGTFGPAVTLSDRSFDSNVGPGVERRLADLGSRLGLVASARQALAVWTDTRAGTLASPKQDVVRAVVTSRRRGLSRPARPVLDAVGAVLLGAGATILALMIRRSAIA